jgi:hypothetical protein
MHLRKIKRLASLTLLVIAVGGCSTATVKHPASTASSTTASSSAPTTLVVPTPTTSSVDPFPQSNGSLLVTMADSGNSYSPTASVYVVIKKLGGPLGPFVDGPTPANAVAFKVTLQDVTGDAFINNDLEGFRFEPSNSGSAFYSNDDTNSANTSLMKKICGTIPMLGTVTTSDTTMASGLDLQAGTSYTGCVVFDFIDPARPTNLTYSDSTNGVTTDQVIWTGSPMKGGAASIPPKTLASWSGSGSQLLTVPSSATNALNVKICWDMTGEGNHIIQAEDSTAGANMDLYTNSVGTEDKQCRDVSGTLPKFLQVLAEDYWTITITGLPTG